MIFYIEQRHAAYIVVTTALIALSRSTDIVECESYTQY